MSEEEKQRDRIHRAALLQAELDDIPIAKEEIRHRMNVWERESNIPLTKWERIYDNLTKTLYMLVEEEKMKIQELKHLKQGKPFFIFCSDGLQPLTSSISSFSTLDLLHLSLEIEANGGKPTLTLKELDDEKRIAIDWYIGNAGETTHEGLPSQNRSNRDSLIAELKHKLVDDDHHQLIIAPYQSGKTSLAQLFMVHLMHERVSLTAPDGNVFFLSLSDFKLPETYMLRSSLGSYLRKETAAMNKRFPNVHPIRGWKAFEDFAKNHNNILVMDESQQLFEYDHFWRIFKTGTRIESCKTLALGSYAFSSLRGEKDEEQMTSMGGMASPVGFIPNSYEILAFNDAEFDEVFYKFKVSSEEAGQPNKFGKDLQKLIKFWATTSEAVKKQQQLNAPLHLELRIYHPGLTFASLLVISQMKYAQNESDVLTALEQTSLYMRLRKKCRCFVSLSQIEQTFICRIKRNFSKQSQGQEDRFDDGSKEGIASAIREFPKTFLNIVIKLLQQGFVVLSNDVVEISYKECLVNNALCFEDDSSDLNFTLRLSCELMREHLAFELRSSFNFNGPAPPLMSFVDAADYVTAVLKKFDPVRLRLYQKSSANGHIYEDSIQTEFVLQSTLHTLHFLQGEFRFNKTSKNDQVGVIDFFVKGKSWGIEFMCFADSRICDDHTRRFEQSGSYMQSKQIAEFVLVDIMHDKAAMPGSKLRKIKPKLATYDSVPDEMLPNILIVHFSADFTVMAIFKIIRGHDQQREFKKIFKDSLSSLAVFKGFKPLKETNAYVTNNDAATGIQNSTTQKKSKKRKTTDQNVPAKQQKPSDD